MMPLDMPVLMAPLQSQPSPEVLTAISNLVKAISANSSSVGDTSSWCTPEGLKAIAAFISAVAWPALALFLIFRFRTEIALLLRRITKLKGFGVEAELQAELDKSAQDAASSQGLSKAPTQDEVRRAENVERLVTPADVELIRQQVDELAAEYETIRANMPSGDARTRRMEVVVSKMRTIGRAAYWLRHQLMQSPSPGHRLQAIASMQVNPDFDLLKWLAQRIELEKPFIGYHAVVALNLAAAGDRAGANLPALEQALEIVRMSVSRLPPDADRTQEVAAFEQRVKALQRNIQRA